MLTSVTKKTYTEKKKEFNEDRYRRPLLMERITATSLKANSRARALRGFEKCFGKEGKKYIDQFLTEEEKVRLEEEKARRAGKAAAGEDPSDSD